MPVLKILKHILNIVIWSALGLYLLIIFTFSIPSVQEYLGQRASHILAKQLGTSVSIGRLKYGLPSHLTLYQVNIKDQSGENLLTAGRISARLDLLPLSEGKISISTAQLFGARAKLYQCDSLAKPNFQFVLDSLASKDTTSTNTLNLRINSLIIRNSSVSYDRYDMPQTAGILNPNHLKVSNISSHIILKTCTEDSLNVNIKRLSFKEQSGLNIKRLSLHFEGGKSSSQLTDFVLRMPGTNIQLGDIKASYRFRGDHFVAPSLRYSGSICPSTITLSDLSCLLPSLNTFQSTLSLSSNFNGEGETVNVPMLNIGSTTGDIGINIGGWVRNLRDSLPSWNADIHDLALSARTVSFISENLQGQSILVPEELVRMGSIHMKGQVQGRGASSIETHNQLQTDAGSVNMSMAIDHQHHFSSHIETKDFNLKKVLDDEQFGMLSTEIDLSGQLPDKGSPLIVKADGMIHQFDFKGYKYQHIDLDGLYSPTDIHGHASIDDSNIGLVVDGSIVQAGQKHNVKLEVTFANVAPKAINLSDKWGEARFFGDIKADFLASDLNDAVGTLDITEFSMQGHNASYDLDHLHIESGYKDDIHYVTMNSDFGEAAIRGDFNYKTIAQSFTNFVTTRMSTIPGLPHVDKSVHNNFSIQATIRKSDWIERILRVPFFLPKPLTLQGSLNDQRQQIVMECDIPQLYYDGSRYDKAHISLLSPINTLQYDVSITKHTDEGNDMDLQVTGSVHNDQISATAMWDDHAAERTSGRVTAMAYFDSSFNNEQTTFVKIASSQMTIKNKTWNISPATISYRNKNLNVNNFSIRHDQQFLSVDGTASESRRDSLKVNMRDIDIEYILELVNFDAVSFNGQLTGGGSLRGVLGELEADAKLLVKGFQFEHGRMGNLDAIVRWNTEKEQIDIQATAIDSKARTIIGGFVSPKRDLLELDFKADGTRLDFAKSFTETFIDHIDGYAEGNVKLAGPLSALNLYGELVLNGKAHVSTLNCTYEMRNDTLQLTRDNIVFKNCVLYDIYGNEAIMTGGIHHNDLTNLTYDIYLDARNLLSYDFKDFDDASFYGTVFADGTVGIHGRENSLLIEADVTPKRGTVFVYNAASPDIITDQEFIVWGTKNEHSSFSRHTAVAAPAAETTPDATEQIAPRDLRTDITMRLRINATPDATVRLLMDERTSDYITLRGSGDLQTSFYNKGSFNMYGTYRISEGTYGITIQNIIKKNFVFKEGGTINFGGDPYDARLNMQAQHTVNGVSLSDLNVGKSFSNTVRVNCLMDISGQPRAPIIGFDLDIPNVNSDEKQMLRSIINSEDEMNQQVIYLLAVGRFYPQGANNASDEETAGRSKTSLAMQSLLSGTLSSQLNDVLNRVIKSNNWSFGANISTGDEGWNNAEYEGIINGRLLNNRLLINGQFGYRDGTTATSGSSTKTASATPSFIGDFDIRYLLLPNGNLALKVYNQTNDRYFTKSSLNTQGIGIIMQKDFNGLHDLLTTKKKKEKKVKNP